ncbi:MAG: putative Histone acetyltransferase [Gemmatimonadetes bacterium]|nr:putative Histone acetyltransferase [Gemmatimonadota bacterium]
MKRRTLAIAAGLALLLGRAPLAAQASSPNLPTLAVLDLTDGGSIGPEAQDLSALGKGLSAMLATEMSRNPRVRLVERDRIQALLGEQRLSLSGVADAATAVRVGRLLGAQYMVLGSYADVYGQLRIDVHVVDVETGQVRRGEEVTDRRENLFRSVSTLAAQTFRNLSLESRGAVADAPEVPAHAALLFSRALAKEDAGDAAGAGALYRQALAVAPAYPDAQTRLARLGSRAGPSPNAVSTPQPTAQGGGMRLDSELPRVVVLMKDEGGTASTALAGFLREAGFPLVDPALARDAAQRDRAARALAGSEADAVALGRDLGAQVIVIGQAPADAGASPADPNLQTGTAQLNVRALRLDDGRVVSTATATGRAVEATAGGARAAALRQAADQLARGGRFLGEVANDWTGHVWNGAAYWAPERGSVSAQLGAVTAGSADRARGGDASLALAIVEAGTYPDSGARGIRVGARTPMRARIRGVLPVDEAQVTVGGHPARVRALTADEQTRYALGRSGVMFEGESPLPAGEDTVRVQAQSGRAMAQSVVRAGVGRRWAVVIGISRYADGSVPGLHYADADARSMYDFLRSPAGGAVPAGQARLLLNEQATTAAIRDALFVFLQQAAEDDQVTVYVASHGAPDPNRPSNLYILSYDTDLKKVASTAFPMWDFQTALRRQIAAQRVVVIADACHSGGALVTDATPINQAFSGLFSPSMRVTLSAADGGEFSREGTQWGGGHGVFTWTLLDGLKGPADADHDGVVTFTEAAAYVRTHVSQATNGEQNPQRAGLGDVPLAFVAATR